MTTTGAADWDERYRGSTRLWSGEPNRYLVAEVGDLPAGTALDAGAGEGADAIWLAEHGWRVTAVDFSEVALDRGEDHAAQHGADVAGRITWRCADLTAWEPGREHYDLVSAQYLHLPTGPRETAFRRLAAAVAPGGSLLIVGHHPSDLQTTMPRPPLPEVYYAGDDVAALLEPGEWDVATNAAPHREATDPEGHAVTVAETVLRAVRHRRDYLTAGNR